eukprot:TRINITY_DN960_c0_g1_i1.p1 TRINITY_DN960_c0_g1~~TRINITY_DN960_c0_g1_i1.p1  ORF type:complete len:449 (+),score=121.18 TRINITY_DN960_c0_g1_i1:97-1347(+)
MGIHIRKQGKKMTDKEAEKYLKTAVEAMQDKDYEDAKKLILKSLKLKTQEKGYKLLAECEAKLAAEGVKKTKENNESEDANKSPSASESPSNKPEDIPKDPGQSPKSEAKDDSSPQAPHDSPTNAESKAEEKVSDEDIAVCEEIMKKSNYYEILSVEKNASEAEIKKQYKQLALKLHPDKNRAPQATEAFKKVSQALACLSNPNKRKIYDEHGSEANFRTNYREYFQDEDDLDPEDLFDLLFNGQLNRNRRRGERRAPHSAHQGQNAAAPVRGKLFMLIQIAPFLLMVVFTLFSQYLQHTASGSIGFSLEQTEKYKFQRSISHLDVDYFVGEDFDTLYDTQEKLAKLERDVIRHALKQADDECTRRGKEKIQLLTLKHKAVSQTEIEKYEDLIEKLDWSQCKRVEQLSGELEDTSN